MHQIKRRSSLSLSLTCSRYPLYGKELDERENEATGSKKEKKRNEKRPKRSDDGKKVSLLK